MISASIKKDLWFIGCIVLLSVWGLQTFFRPGLFETHDGRLHLIRLFWFDEELSSGQFPVRWSETANHQYGYPVFNFYYPFFYLAAEAMHLVGFSLVDSLKIVVAGGFILSGIAAYLWLKSFTGRWPALAGTILFLLAPYRLELMYVMGRWAESWAILPAVLALGTKGKLQGLFIALLILSHNAVALLFLPVIFVYTVILRPEAEESRRSFASFRMTGFIFGLGLSAFFWLPAMAEVKYTLQGQRPVYDFRENFPAFKSYLYYPWGYGFSLKGEPGGVSPMIGLGQLAGVGVGLIVLILTYSNSNVLKNLRMAASSSNNKRNLVLGIVGFLATFLMMNSAAIPVWEKLPLLQKIQFPGRLQVVLLTMIAITIATALQGLTFAEVKVRPLVAIFLISLTVYANRNYLRAGVPDRFSDQDVTDLYWFRFGTGDSSHESTPVWSRPLPSEWEQKIEADSENVEISQIEVSPRKYRFTADVGEGEGVIRVNTIYYPGWRAAVDGKELKLAVSESGDNPNGLIKFEVTPGIHQIKVWFGETPLRLAADMVSAVSLITWGVLKNQRSQMRADVIDKRLARVRRGVSAKRKIVD